MTTDHPSLDAIAGYRAGALTDTRAADAMGAHLSECESCATAAGSLDEVSAVLAAVASQPVPMPLSVQNRIDDVLHRERVSQALVSADDRRTAPRPTRMTKWPLMAAAAVAVTVAGYAGLAADLGGGSESDHQASAAADAGPDRAAAAGRPRTESSGAAAQSDSAAPPAPRVLTKQNLPRYASEVSRGLVAAARATRLPARCADPTTSKGEVVTTDRWKGSLAVVVVRPAVRRVTVFDCRSASVLFSTGY